jgi:glycerol-3-phosphate acyltransferase PlsY
MMFLTAVLIAYLCGSIPFGLLIGRWVKGIDVREHGSKNSGATNVFRVVGKKWGILVFVLDAAKGYAGVMLGCAAAQVPVGSGFSYFLAVAAIFGHTFSLWLKFKGGKGVATSLGVFLAAALMPTLIAFGLWIVVFAGTHIVSISSLAAAAAFPILSILAVAAGREHAALVPISLLLCGFIFYTHRENIKRLRKGEEKRLF